MITLNMSTLKYFVQTYTDKSITKAAKTLYISPQGLSKAIRMLESDFGVPLFCRNNKGIFPTEYGDFLFQHAQKLTDEYDKLMNGFQEYITQKKKTLRIGFAFGTIQALGLDFLQEFNELYSNINIEYRDYTDYECEDKLLKGEVDVAFSVGPFDYDKFESIPIMRENYYFLINIQNSLAQKSDLSFQDIKNEKIACAGQDFKAFDTMKSLCNKYNFTPNIVFTTREVMLLEPLVAKNNVISFAIEHIVRNQLRDERVKALPIKDEEFIWEVGILTKKDTKHSIEERTFIQYTTQYFLPQASL